MKQSISNKIRNAPKTPGVYIFYDKSKKPLYIGKAVNLRSRLLSYLKLTDAKNILLNKEVSSIKYLQLRSDIEALITESRLIKELKPKYNIIWRDDKSYVYVAITKNLLPKIFVIHANRIPEFQKSAEIIGPYTEGFALRSALRFLRKQFPYCTCKTDHYRFCLNSEIGKCVGYCCRKSNSVSPANIKKKYAKNIRIIKNFLLGKFTKSRLKQLEKEERVAIERILAHKDYLQFSGLETTKNRNREAKSEYSRAECYDISHLSGKESVGGMTSWVFAGNEWIADKNMWRKFKIRTAAASDDTGAMKEVLNRRLNHPEWKFPDLVIIDGGLGQLNAARYVFLSRNIKNIKLISFAKPEQKILGLEPDGTPIDKADPILKKLVLKAIAETHRFAITYHRKVRNKKFLLK